MREEPEGPDEELEDEPVEDSPEEDEGEEAAAPEQVEDPRDVEIRMLREHTAKLERMTASRGYQDVTPSADDSDDIDAGQLAALEGSDDPRDKLLAKALRRTSVAERKVAMIEEAQDLGATPSQMRQMRKLVESGHAGSMTGAKLILRGLEAEDAERTPVRQKTTTAVPASVKNPKVPPSREVAREAAIRVQQLRRNAGATGAARRPEGEETGTDVAPTEESGEGGPRLVKASTWKAKLDGPKGREWFRAERAGRVRVIPG